MTLQINSIFSPRLTAINKIKHFPSDPIFLKKPKGQTGLNCRENINPKERKVAKQSAGTAANI